MAEAKAREGAAAPLEQRLRRIPALHGNSSSSSSKSKQRAGLQRRRAGRSRLSPTMEAREGDPRSATGGPPGSHQRPHARPAQPIAPMENIKELQVVPRSGLGCSEEGGREEKERAAPPEGEGDEGGRAGVQLLPPPLHNKPL